MQEITSITMKVCYLVYFKSDVRRDIMLYNYNQFDDSWDAVWEAAANIDEEGWAAEMRIPLSQLRYNCEETGGERNWGINFLREIAR
jgi:hypothetical protein